MERLMSDGYPFIFQLFLMTSSSILEEMICPYIYL